MYLYIILSLLWIIIYNFQFRISGRLYDKLGIFQTGIGYEKHFHKNFSIKEIGEIEEEDENEYYSDGEERR